MRFLIYTLAVWRLTYILTQENGPSDAFARLREWSGVHYSVSGKAYGTSFLGDILACFWCCSVWVSGILLVLPRIVQVWLAGSAAAILLDKGIKHVQ